MKQIKKNNRSCFGELDTVFPKGEDGLRNTPDACLACDDKTECLKAAMGESGGMKVQEELVDRAYESGMIGFWKRWSKKKELYRKMKKD
ncbi:hypothetical protein QUF72_14210 [Desulfobacterales bacterium HSG2]|nr:hypothetical protein [Desulfobacterales bacterium HSG2]